MGSLPRDHARSLDFPNGLEGGSLGLTEVMRKLSLVSAGPGVPTGQGPGSWQGCVPGVPRQAPGGAAAAVGPHSQVAVCACRVDRDDTLPFRLDDPCGSGLGPPSGLGLSSAPLSLGALTLLCGLADVPAPLSEPEPQVLSLKVCPQVPARICKLQNPHLRVTFRGSHGSCGRLSYPFEVCQTGTKRMWKGTAGGAGWKAGPLNSTFPLGAPPPRCKRSGNSWGGQRASHKHSARPLPLPSPPLSLSGPKSRSGGGG